MITDVYVDGFRSLSDFRLKVRPGLNILVGPNGSGKTNIISFLQFLHQITQGSLNSAISNAGGAGGIFRKVGEKQFESRISVRVGGNVNIPPETKGDRTEKFRYQYNFVIKASDGFENIYFHSQEVFLRKLSNREPMLISERNLVSASDAIGDQAQVWDFHVVRNIDDSDNSNNKIVKFDRIILTKQDYIFNNLQKHQKDSNEGIRFIEGLLDSLSQIDECLLQSLSGTLRAIFSVSLDFAGSSVLNIVPSKVKEPEDSSKEIGIGSDGSGLAATLYHLKKLQGAPIKRQLYMRPTQIRSISSDLNESMFTQVEDYIKLVNETVDKITIDNEPFDNVLKFRVHIRGEGET